MDLIHLLRKGFLLHVMSLIACNTFVYMIYFLFLRVCLANGRSPRRDFKPDPNSEGECLPLSRELRKYRIGINVREFQAVDASTCAGRV
jgi:hypothetical protein